MCGGIMPGGIIGPGTGATAAGIELPPVSRSTSLSPAPLSSAADTATDDSVLATVAGGNASTDDDLAEAAAASICLRLASAIASVPHTADQS